MTDEQKRLLKAMKSAYIRASLVLCGIAAACAGIVVLNKSWGLWLLLVLDAAFMVYAVVFNAAAYKKGADIIKNTTAEKCIVENFLIMKRYDGGYEYAPVLRDPNTGELLFTFGEYDKSLYVKIPVKKRSELDKLQIQRHDRSVVKVGDTVLVYIKSFTDRKLDPQTDLDKDADDYDLKASVMKEVKVFEGVIDIEK